MFIILYYPCRVGHTWIPQAMRLFDRSLQKIYDPNFNRKTEDTFNNPDLTFQPLAFERLAYYMSGSQSPNTDRSYLLVLIFIPCKNLELLILIFGISPSIKYILKLSMSYFVGVHVCIS
jgi:hypothetical protein